MDNGTLVRVYRNLHKDCYTIQTKTPKGWRVAGYANSLNLTNVEFKVSQSGRDRVLRENKKYVHAYVIGNIDNTNKQAFQALSGGQEAYYNPHKTETFISGLLPLEEADYAHLSNDFKIFVIK